METSSGYKTRFEKKNQRLDVRLDTSMIQKLKQIRRETGISISEIVRESVRRLIQETEIDGNINLRLY